MNLIGNFKTKLFKDFTKYVSLNVLSMIGLSFYIFADTLYVANGIGSKGLIALNLAIPVYSFINGIGLMLGMGAATKYSILRGKNNFNEANKTFTQVIYIAIIISVILTLLGAIFSHEIAKLLGANEAVLPLAAEYLKVILIFSFAFIVNNIMICFIRNDNNPNIAMMAMLVGSFSNVILDYICIFILNLGMFGAAIATGFAPIFSMCILSIHFIKKKNNFKLVKCYIKANCMKNILLLGSSSFITEFSSGIIMMIFNFIILGIEGNIGVAAYGIIANVALIVISIFTGIGQGIQPLISNNYGLGKIENVKKIYKYALILATIFGLIFYSIALTFPHFIVEIFNKENNELLKQISVSGMKFYFIAFLVMGINIITTSLFSSVNRPREAFVISMTRGFFAIIPIVIVLSKALGIRGVWLTIPVTEIIVLFISVYNINKYYKESNNI